MTLQAGGAHTDGRSYIFTSTHQSKGAMAETSDGDVQSHAEQLAIPSSALDDASFVGKTGAQIFHDLMVHHGVELIFG